MPNVYFLYTVPWSIYGMYCIWLSHLDCSDCRMLLVSCLSGVMTAV